MGEAKRNPRSFASGRSKAEIEYARLQKIAAGLTTPDRVDVFLEQFHPQVVPQVEKIIRPLLPPQPPRVPMVEVVTEDPTHDAAWPTVKGCQFRLIRKLECGCFAVGYGYSTAHAAQRAEMAATAHNKGGSLCINGRKRMGHDGGFCPACGGDPEIAAMSMMGPHLYWPCKTCEPKQVPV